MDLSIYKAKPNKSIRQHTDELIENLNFLKKLGYIKDEYIFNLTKIACEYHDFGKANREFQKRIKYGTKFDTEKEVAHNILSLYFINPKEFDKIEDYYRVAFAILFHHYYCDNLMALKDSKIRNISKDLLSDFETNKLKLNTANQIKKFFDDKDAILIKGLLNKCDYSSSGESVIEYKNNFLDDGLRNLLDKWKLKDKDADWNELQNFCVKNRDENIIAVAQTGMGKTEAGLQWIGNNKGFFILPIKTAINAIYKRICDEIISENIEHKVALLHSDTLSYYNSHNNDMDILQYNAEGKQLAIPITICTLDQIFDFVLKYKGYEMKLATLSYSKIVIDEIQMYGPDLLAYLIFGIKTIIKFGGKVAILTATLAPFIKDLLNDDKKGVKFKEEVFINDQKRHNIKVYDSKINSEIIYKKYVENESKNISNKILVVCNTVKKAQAIYRELKEKGVKNINIFHSKFIKKERSEKEEEILKFGETENIDSGIWISTQIVEASLDIDFDYLFTELSDISSLLQRLGRCNRKGTKSVDEYNCYVFLEIDQSILIDGDKGFIDKKIYYISKNALKEVDGVLSEQDKLDIINNNLTTAKIKGSDYWRKYIEFSNWIKDIETYEINKKDINLRNIVSFDIIPKEVYLQNQEEIDTNIDKLKNKDNSTLEKLKLIDEIKKFTLSISGNDMKKLGEKSIYKNIELSSYQEIPVMDCEYNDLGFIGNSK